MRWNQLSKKYRESKVIKNILKILLIGFAAAIIRIIELSIPVGEQTILVSSIFAQNGPQRPLTASLIQLLTVLP